MADRGATGQQLRNMANHVSEKCKFKSSQSFRSFSASNNKVVFFLAINAYIKNSKATQRTNAMLLAGFTPKKDDKKPEVKVPEAPEKVQKVEVSTDKPIEAFTMFANSNTFEGCTFEINVSK